MADYHHYHVLNKVWCSDGNIGNIVGNNIGCGVLNISDAGYMRSLYISSDLNSSVATIDNISANNIGVSNINVNTIYCSDIFVNTSNIYHGNFSDVTANDTYFNLVNSNTNTSNIGNFHNIYTSDINVDNLVVNDANISNIIASDVSIGYLNTNGIFNGNMVVIDNVRDFIKYGNITSDNIIRLTDNKMYIFSKMVELRNSDNNVSYKIKCGNNNSLTSFGTFSGGFYCSGLTSDNWLVEANKSVSFQNIRVDGSSDINQNAIKLLASDITMNAEFNNVMFNGFKKTILLDGVNNCVGNSLYFNNSSNIELNTTTHISKTISFMNCGFLPKTSDNMFVINSSFNSNRRLRIAYSAFINNNGISINMASDASLTNIPYNSFIIKNNHFSGTGTYIQGVGVNDNRNLWKDNIGIVNNSNCGYFRMSGNTSDIIVSNTTSFFKLRGNSVAGSMNQRYNKISDNVVQYVGIPAYNQKIMFSGDLSSNLSNNLDFSIFKNGSIISDSIFNLVSSNSLTGAYNNFNAFVVCPVVQSDIFDVRIRNTSNTNNINCENMSLLFTEMY